MEKGLQLRLSKNWTQSTKFLLTIDIMGYSNAFLDVLIQLMGYLFHSFLLDIRFC